MKFIISGGGTGGHIFPAIAIADAIKRQDANAEILFVGALGKMEMERVPKAGYPIEGLWISGLQRRLSLDLFKFPFKLISSWWKSRQILKKFKPDAVVGVGGYASGVIVRTAASWDIPTLIHEQNSFAGLTNRTLGKSVTKICVAADNMGRFFPQEKMLHTGNPIRQDIIDISGKREEAAAHYGFDASRPVLLVLGGSLGARTLNDSLLLGMQALQDADIQVLWQCGKLYYEEFAPKVTAFGKTKLVAFIDRMDLAYALSDVVVSRAGALSVSEIAVAKRPAIFVPSPNVTDDHQTANAMSLVKENAALLVKDADARGQLVSAAIALLQDAAQQKTLVENIAKMAITDAADRIAAAVIGIVKQGTQLK